MKKSTRQNMLLTCILLISILLIIVGVRGVNIQIVEHGGVKNIIISAGKEVKSIYKEIKED